MYLRTLLGIAACGALTGGVGGCGGKATPKEPPIKVQPKVDSRKAERGAKDTIEEIYETLNHGKADSLFSLLSDRLLVFGPRRADAMATRSDALVALGKYIDPKAKDRIEVESTTLEVLPAPGGNAAWAFDVVTAGNESITALMILANDGDLWSVTTVSMAHTPSMREIRRGLKKVAVVPPAAKAPAKVDSRAQGAVEQFQKGLLDQTSWGEDLASRTDAVVIGPGEGDIARGKKAIKKLWQQRTDAHTRAAVSGEISAAITPDGQLAWVTAPVTRVEDDESPLPLRVFAVFEKDDERWKMIALQESVAIDEPGAGASFVKILPPEPKPPEPPPAEDNPKETKSKVKKGKKHKKPKSSKVKIVDEE